MALSSNRWAYSLKPIDASHSAMPFIARPVDGVLHHFHRELKLTFREATITEPGRNITESGRNITQQEHNKRSSSLDAPTPRYHAEHRTLSAAQFWAGVCTTNGFSTGTVCADSKMAMGLS
jgi:hypothetical protein